MIFPKTNSYEKLNQPFLDVTAQKLSKYGVFSGPYFPVFGLKISVFSPNKGNKDQKKLHTWDTFHTVHFHITFHHICLAGF